MKHLLINLITATMFSAFITFSGSIMVYLFLSIFTGTPQFWLTLTLFPYFYFIVFIIILSYLAGAEKW